MVIEQALLVIKEGHEQAFEADFTKAIAFVEKADGFLQYSLNRGIEQANHYLLLVHWNRLEDHTVSFVESGLREQWRSQVQHYFQPGTAVRHFTNCSQPSH